LAGEVGALRSAERDEGHRVRLPRAPRTDDRKRCIAALGEINATDSKASMDVDQFGDIDDRFSARC
jgi:hypothetical protein